MENRQHQIGYSHECRPHECLMSKSYFKGRLFKTFHARQDDIQHFGFTLMQSSGKAFLRANLTLLALWTIMGYTLSEISASYG